MSEGYRYIWLVLVCLYLGACGGGGKTSHQSSSVTTSSQGVVSLSGRVTYDYVPHKTTLIGLNYNAIESRPVRGVQVELIGQSGQILAVTSTDADGHYQVAAPANTAVRVRVKAQLLSVTAPAWDFSVRDNTSGNALYVMDGSLASTGKSDSTRDLHAASGWTGVSYGSARVAAPFAILDDIYVSLQRFVAVGYQQSFPVLTIFWSTKNKAVDGDPGLGEINTTYYSDSAIYVLGDANADTDEYDAHVILHEWGHYIETALSRTDTLGGDHSQDLPLDMRLAMSEGFSTAWASVLLNNPLYADSLGIRQSDGFYFDASEKNPDLKGWYSEASVSSIIYNYYTSSKNKTARNFSDVISAVTADDFINAEGAVSIFTFAESVRRQFPEHMNTINELLTEQHIFGADEFGLNETNDGGRPDVLPVYKPLVIDGGATIVCSSNIIGTFNKLGVHQFLQLTVNNGGNFQVSATRSTGQSLTTNPNVEIFHRGIIADDGTSPFNNSEVFTTFLSAGNYLVVVYDQNNFDPNMTNTRRSCFDVRIDTKSL